MLNFQFFFLYKVLGGSTLKRKKYWKFSINGLNVEKKGGKVNNGR